MAVPGYTSKRRTANQAIQGDKLDVQSQQKALGQRRKQLHREVSSYSGAGQAVQQQIARQQAKLPSLGLQGTPEGRQLGQEYRSRARDIQQSLPFLVAATQREGKADIAGIQSDLQNALLQLQQDRQDRAQAIKDQLATIAQNKSEKRAGVDNAYREALRLIHKQQLTNADPNAKDSDKGAAVPQNPLEWINFEEALRRVEGVDNRSATKAIRALQRRLATIHGGPTNTPFEQRFPAPGR